LVTLHKTFLPDIFYLLFLVIKLASPKLCPEGVESKAKRLGLLFLPASLRNVKTFSQVCR